MNTKQLIALFLVFGMMLCLCACTNADITDPTTEPTTKTTVPTTNATEPTTEEPADPTYVVTVVDEENAPVAGAWVQLCLESCVPAMTDENGVANFFLEEADYKVAFTVMPPGYEYAGEEQEWHFAEGENTMTITLKKVA